MKDERRWRPVAQLVFTAAMAMVLAGCMAEQGKEDAIPEKMPPRDIEQPSRPGDDAEQPPEVDPNPTDDAAIPGDEPAGPTAPLPDPLPPADGPSVEPDESASQSPTGEIAEQPGIRMVEPSDPTAPTRQPVDRLFRATRPSDPPVESLAVPDKPDIPPERQPLALRPVNPIRPAEKPLAAPMGTSESIAVPMEEGPTPYALRAPDAAATDANAPLETVTVPLESRRPPEESSPEESAAEPSEEMAEGPEEAAPPMVADTGDEPTDSGAGQPESPQDEKAEKDYTVVEVFYGTDRKPQGVGGVAFPVGWTIAATIAGLITALLAVLAWRGKPRTWLRVTAIAGVGLTLLFGGAAALVVLHQPLTAMFASESNEPSDKRPTIRYGNERGELEYGVCEVSIPKEHEVGELEAPSIWTLEFHERPERHVVLMDIQTKPADEFFEQVRACVDRSTRKSAFVFVHGFNVTFEDAARRTAQIAYDLGFDGAPIFYSWPSQGGLLKYTIDENNVRWTVQHLRIFLRQVAEHSGAKRIHLVAHSMGNRALTGALRDLAFLPEDERPRFNEIVLTAPDIDAEVFRTDIAPHIIKTGERVTLYASSNDTALAYSKQIHGYPRAGETGDNLLVLPGMDTVDVSAVDTSLLGHNYYGDNETVLSDLVEVLHEAKPPSQRAWLEAVPRGPLQYWVFREYQ